jgi:hypothetical protein
MEKSVAEQNAELIKDLLNKANGLGKIALIFNEKLHPLVEEAEEDTVTLPKGDLKSVLDLLESFPTVFQLLNNHIGGLEEKHVSELAGYKQREAEWEKLSELFNAFKRKLTGMLFLLPL